MKTSQIAAAFLIALACLLSESSAIAQSGSEHFDFSAGDRWRKFSRDAFASRGPYVGSAVGGALDLAGNSPEEWGQDLDSYGVYVGDVFGRNLVQQSVTQVGQALLGLDPTYRRCECTGGLPRVFNALAGAFTSFDRFGKRRFDPMPLVGGYGSGLVAASWYPRGYETRVKGIQLGHQQFAAVPLSNLLSEFSPELKRLNPFRRRR